ncbi:MAG TPA: crossover junction endodeoxyribonuclease RuvC [Candidatus Sulfotelmatobacter sp.]|nr:crossover junction endodeoxyribonuclease RuvC [Candidatus Sulfotelmatobacter sp.]
MKVLGIDPGIGRCGWAVITSEKSKLNAIAFGCIETSSKKEIPERLREVYEEISKIIKKYEPNEFSIEELFFGTNTKTAFVVGQARGVILLAAAQKKLNIGIYTPLQVKIALTGYGKAEKSQVGKMVKAILSLKEVPTPDDTADALAVAITHAFSQKSSKLRVL